MSALDSYTAWLDECYRAMGSYLDLQVSQQSEGLESQS